MKPVERLIQEWSTVATLIRLDAVKLLDQGVLEIEDDNLAQPHVFAAALLSRTICNLKAVFVLVEAGMVVEARAITRCCIENVIWLRRLATEGAGFVQEIIADHRTQDIAFAKAILPLPVASFLEEDEVLHLWQQAGLKRQGTVSPSDKLQDEEARADYTLFKLLSGDAAHPSARSLSWHLPDGVVDGRTEFHIEPQVTTDAVRDIMYFSCGALVKAMELYNRAVPRPEAGQHVQQAFDRVTAMLHPADA